MEGFIESIEIVENEDVFDLTVDETHCFFANDLLVHNCAEQSLEDYETCCLAEVFIPRLESKQEFIDLVKLLYRINKHSLNLKCHHKETETVVHKNMRMGIGITGILAASEEQINWLDDCYKELREYDKEYSKKHGFPESIKLTTCKPSGTLSLLPPGIPPGIHPAYSQYMIRRVRIASDHPLLQVAKDHGYPTEFQKNFDGTIDHGTAIIEFPYAYPEGTILAKDMTAIQQLEWVKKINTLWSDNSVSCTVYYRQDELPEIREYLSKNYNKGFKSLSFLLHTDHGFIQAPLEPISKEEYDRRVASSRIITSGIGGLDLDSSTECAGGACPVR